MLCNSCGKLDCSCDKPQNGPKTQKYSTDISGSSDPWSNAIPSVTSAGPRVDNQPFNNSPKQPRLESK